MGHSEHGFQGFYSLLPLYAIILPSLSANSVSFLTLSLGPLNRIFWNTQLYSIYGGSDSLPGFPNTSLVFSIFSLCVKSNTFFIRISLPLYHSFIVRPPFLWKFSTFCSFPKIQKSCFVPQLRKKYTMKQIVYEKTKVDIPNLLWDKKTEQVS